MTLRRVGWLVVQAVVVVVVVALLAGQLLGQPLLFSFATTDSMADIITPPEGFVVLPPEITGEVGEGDVVVFEAEEIQGGRLTVQLFHRRPSAVRRPFLPGRQARARRSTAWR